MGPKVNALEKEFYFEAEERCYKSNKTLYFVIVIKNNILFVCLHTNKFGKTLKNTWYYSSF